MRSAAFLFVLAGLIATGCHRTPSAESPEQNEGLLAQLHSADADERKDAAEELREHGGPPEGAVAALLEAAAKEQDEDALTEMLLTLGESGKDEARPALEAAVRGDREDARKAAYDGLLRWAKKRGEKQPKHIAAMAALGAPDDDMRAQAAEDLGDDDGPPPEAMAPLLAALAKETDEKAHCEMLETVGKSGAPEAKGPIEAALRDDDDDVRSAAQKALKRWRKKNGEAVRADVETAQKPATGAAPAAANAPDGCDQFKAICADDPFDTAQCKAELGPLSYEQKVSWANCINVSPDPCQKAHNTCIAKAKTAKAP